MTRARYQEGSLQIRGTGAKAEYYTRFRVYDAITGKISHPKVSIGLVSKIGKRDALKKRAEIIAERLHQLPKPADAVHKGDTTFENFYKDRFLIMKSDWSEVHRKNSAQLMNKYILPKFGGLSLASIDKVDIQVFLNSMKNGYSKSTIKHIREKFVEILEEAVDQDFIPKNPAKKTKVPSEARAPEKPTLKAEQLKDLINKITDARDKALFMVATFCALRTSEVFGLPWKNFHHDPATGEAYFLIDQIAFGGKVYERTKTDASKAHVHISAKTLQAILQWKKECEDTSPDALMFPSTNKNGRSKKGAPMWAGAWLQKHLQPIAVKLGIEFPVNFRATRRTAATLVQEQGHSLASAQGFLRHESASTTADVYTQQVPEAIKKAVNGYEESVMSDPKPKPKTRLTRVK